jgi:hypothetical protein
MSYEGVDCSVPKMSRILIKRVVGRKRSILDMRLVPDLPAAVGDEWSPYPLLMREAERFELSVRRTSVDVIILALTRGISVPFELGVWSLWC